MDHRLSNDPSLKCGGDNVCMHSVHTISSVAAKG